MQVSKEEVQPTGPGLTQPQSPFVEVKDLDFTKSVNIMIQAANAAQRAGALAVRDAVLVAAAAEFLSNMRDLQPKSDK
jgi:hypothetical protein